MLKSIHTLVEDIYHVADSETSYNIDRNLLTDTLNDISMALTRPLSPEENSKYYLRPSNVGKGLRWHYFMSKYPQTAEKFDGRMKMLFQAGHVQEAVLLMYAKLAGHKVEAEQRSVSIDGVSGSLDCLIDDYLIDVKTTSSYSFQKFSNGEVSLDNDSFGYIAQLSTYKAGLQAEGIKVKGQGWLAYNKNNSELALCLIPDDTLIDAYEKIQAIKKAQKRKTMPKELCPTAEPKVDSHGNELMSITCEYCPFKNKCFPEFRVYRYASKDKFFVSVKKEPRVQEVTNEYR